MEYGPLNEQESEESQLYETWGEAGIAHDYRADFDRAQSADGESDDRDSTVLGQHGFDAEMLQAAVPPVPRRPAEEAATVVPTQPEDVARVLAHAIRRRWEEDFEVTSTDLAELRKFLDSGSEPGAKASGAWPPPPPPGLPAAMEVQAVGVLAPEAAAASTVLPPTVVPAPLPEDRNTARTSSFSAVTWATTRTAS